MSKLFPIIFSVAVLAAVFCAVPANGQSVTAEWLSPISGNWTDASKWTTNPNYPKNNSPPATTYDVLIDAVGSPYTLTLINSIAVSNVTLNSPDALLNHYIGTFNVSEIIDISAGTYSLGNDAVLENATVRTSGTGQFILSSNSNYSPTIRNVTLQTDLSLPSEEDLYINNGLTLDNAQIVMINNVSGSSSPDWTTIEFTNAQSVMGTGEIVFNGTARYSAIRATSGMVTFGSNLVIRTGTQGGTIGTNNDPSAIFVNQGLISAETANRTMELVGKWRNEGVLRLSNGSLKLGGEFSTEDIGVIDRTGGVLDLTGTLNNTGATLHLDSSTGDIRMTENAAILGGTISSSNGAKLAVWRNEYSAFNLVMDGVALDTNVELAVYTGIGLKIRNGLVLSEGREIVLAADNYADNSLYFEGSQVLSGDGEVVFNGTDNLNQVEPRDGALTIGSGITIRTGTGGGVIGGTTGSLINRGLISSQTLGRTVRLVGNWTNTGTLRVSDGTLSLGGSFTTSGIGTVERTGGQVHIVGSLNNTANTLFQNESIGSFTLATGGKITGGTITSSTTTPLRVNGNATLDGVRIAGEILLDPAADLTLQNGMELQSATLRMKGASNSSYLRFQPNMLLAGTGEIVFDSPGYTLNYVTANEGLLIVPAGLTVRTGTGGGTIQTNGVGRSLENYGLISAETAAQRISISDRLTKNFGTIRALNGATMQISSSSDTDLFRNDAELLAESNGVMNIYGIYGTVENRGSATARNGGTLTLAKLINTGEITSEDGGVVRLLTGWSNPTGGSIHSEQATVYVGLPSGGFGTFLANQSNIFFTGTFTPAQTSGINASNCLFGIDQSGVIDNSSSSLVTNVGSSRWQIAGGRILGGQITTTNNTALLASSSTSTLDNIILNTDLEISGGATVKVQNTLSLSDGRSITGTGKMTFSSLVGTHTMRAVSGSFSIASGITIQNAGYSGILGDPTTGVISAGRIYADSSNVTLTVRGNRITNDGTFEAANGGTLRVPDAVNLTNFSGSTLTGGVWRVGTSSTIDLAGIAISHNDAEIHIQGNNASFDAIDSIDSNNGKLTLSNMASFGIQDGLANSGEVVVEAGSLLSLAGNFSQSDSGQLTVHIQPQLPWSSEAVGYLEIQESAQLSGTLKIVMTYAFVAPGHSYEIIEANSVAGQFGTILGRELLFGRYFDVNYGDTSVSLVVQQAGPGDSDFDGDVDLSDLGVLATNYGKASGALWSEGDYDGDGDVDLNDLGTLATNYGVGSAQAYADFHAMMSVPEPAACVWWMAALVAGRRRAAPRGRTFLAVISR